MKKILGLLIAATLMSSCSEAQVKADQNSKDSRTETVVSDEGTQINQVVSAAKFKELMGTKDAQIIDVRTPGEYKAGNIAASSNVDFYGDNFKNELAKLDKTKPLLVYCKSGGRSGKAASMMKSMGFEEVYDLKGGYSGWPFK